MYACPADYRFVHTATGILGEKRDTMLENPLLLRNQLGKPSRRGYRGYPGDEERYGMPNPDGMGGVREAMRWKPEEAFHLPTNENKKMNRDFKALNKSSINAGIVTSNEQYQYRNVYDIRLKPELRDRERFRPKPLPPSMVFGIQSRPSTPIHDIIEHKYQDRWLAERRSADAAHYKAAAKEESQSAKGPQKVKETKASQLRIFQIPVTDPPIWKMPKFTKKAAPCLDTFRAEPPRKVAYDYQKLDGINRKGTFNLGVYEAAKC